MNTRYDDGFAYVEFSELVGKTLVNVERTNFVGTGDVVRLHASDGSIYRLDHRRDCCESVHLEEVIGELTDLLGSPLVLAELVTSGHRDADSPRPSEYAESWTWSFYKLATVRGAVTLRWLGESNGYYSETVDFVRERGPTAEPAS